MLKSPKPFIASHPPSTTSHHHCTLSPRVVYYLRCKYKKLTRESRLPSRFAHTMRWKLIHFECQGYYIEALSESDFSALMATHPSQTGAMTFDDAAQRDMHFPRILAFTFYQYHRNTGSTQRRLKLATGNDVDTLWWGCDFFSDVIPCEWMETQQRKTRPL